MIVEVLSASTKAYDRGRKFDYYRSCPSIQEYVLVNSDRRLIEAYRRSTEPVWTYHTFEPEDQVGLASIDARFRVAEVYVDVDVLTTAPGVPGRPTQSRQMPKTTGSAE